MGRTFTSQTYTADAIELHIYTLAISDGIADEETYHHKSVFHDVSQLALVTNVLLE